MRKSKKQRKLIIIISIVAALIIAVAVAVALILCGKEDETRESIQETQTPTQTTAEPVQTKEPPKYVVEAPGNITARMDIKPGSGEVLVFPMLLEKAADYGYDNTLFHIKIWVTSFARETFTHEGKTMEEYGVHPMLELYDEVHEVWKEEVYKPLDAEMVAAEQRGEEHAQGWEKHDPDALFREYFYETQSEDVIEAYEEARGIYREAHDAREIWKRSDERKINFIERMQSETERLAALGLELEYDYEYSRGSVEGYLTRRQIEQFPASDDFGYMIMWWTKNDAPMNE